MLKDLSLFAVFNMIGAAFFTLLIVPHLYKDSGLKTHKEVRYRNNKVLKWFFNHAFEQNRVLILVIIVITIVCTFFINNVEFEADLTALNYKSPRLIAVEKKIGASDNKLESIMLVSENDDLDSALIKNEQIYNTIKPLQENGVLEKIVSVSSLIKSPEEQNKKIERWREFWTKQRIASVRNMIESSGRNHSFKAGSFSKFYNTLGKDFKNLSNEDCRKLSDTVFSELVSDKNGRTQFVTILKADKGKIKDFYSTVEKRGDIFFNVLIADNKNLTNKFIDSIKDNFNSLSILDSLIVFSILLLFLGRFELAVISFIPIALSWVWILGLMGMAGIKFNIFNIIISSILFGLGVDYSIIMVEGLIYQYKHGGHGLESSRESIFFSALVNITGMGILIFAKHPVLKSIAVISSIGILSVYIISNIIPPLLFRFLTKTMNTFRPLKFSSVFSAIIIYSIFTFGCLILTVFSLAIQLLPVPKKIKTKILLFIIMLSCRIISRYSLIFPFYSSLIIENRYKEKFDKPAVIIANHQSMLDIIFFLSLSPKIIVLTKDWIWNSRLLGIIVRRSGYLPVSSGIENYIDKIKEKVDDGYSVLIFPEGERSESMEIKRFHKGAFYIAGKLNLDILPIVIHGTGHIVRKSTLSLYSGSALLSIGERIPVNNDSYGSSYSEKAKNVRKIFSDKYLEIRRERESASYFADFLIDQYIYKDPVTELYMRVKLKLEDNYEFFNSLIPRDSSIVDLGCGYGFLSYILALCSSERRVTGVDFDKEKISVAKSISIPCADIQFEYADTAEYILPGSDVFIMIDILHYMPEEMQVKLITGCMSKINQGGMIIIREANKDFTQRHFYTRLSERFSAGINFNKTKYKNMFFLSGSFVQSIADQNGFSCTIHDRSKKTSNEIYILRKK